MSLDIQVGLYALIIVDEYSLNSSRESDVLINFRINL